MNTRILNIIALFAFAGFLSACESSDYNETPAVSFTLPDRQILALNENRLLVEINVNNGTKQKVFIEPDQTTIDISVDGVRDNQNNTFDILWSEIYNEIAIEIALQSQEIFGRENIFIDAPHGTEGFDYDGDGVSNIDERLAGSCVWYTGNQCFLGGNLDLPTSPALSQGLIADNSFDYDNANDMVVNGDFSRGIEGWQSEYASLEIVDTHLCTTLQAGPIPTQYPVLSSKIELEPGNYMIEFDVKSTRQHATLNVSLYSPSLRQAVLYQFVKPLSIDWESRQVKFTHTGVQDRVSLGFSGIINSAQTTTYCFDNIVFLKAR